MMTIKTLHKITAGLAVAVVFSSCVKDENSAGYEYMPDMYRSPAIETYVDYGEVRTWKYDTSLTNRQSALMPPLGTVPFVGENVDVNYSLPYKRLPSKAMVETHGLVSLEYNDGDYEASASDVNPMPMYASNVDNGKVLYERFCDHCHGEKGAGDGKVSNHDAINPPANAFEKPEGQMYYSITYGKGVMGAHNTQLNKKEIWQVISYIKSMNGAEVLPDPEMDSEMTDEAPAGDLSSSLSELFSHAGEANHGEGHEGDDSHSGGVSVTLKGLEFETGSSTLNMAKSQNSLNILLNQMKNSDVAISLEGYTDNTGNPASNLALSDARAKALKTYLVSNGIAASRIDAMGMGDKNPKASNDTEEGRAQNRRTEVKLK